MATGSIMIPTRRLSLTSLRWIDRLLAITSCCQLRLTISCRVGMPRIVPGTSSYQRYISIFRGLGFSLEETSFALSYSARFRLVEAPLADFQASRTERLRITTVGAYTLKYLPALFTYCDAVVVDTPIIDPEVRSRIVDARSLAERVARVERLKAYLDASWADAALEGSSWSWVGVSEGLDLDLQRVRARVK